MDERADRGEFYPGGDRSGGAPAPQPSDKVDRVNVGEVGESYTLKDVKNKVNQIVRVIAPAAVCLALAVVRLLSYAATAPLEDIPNTAPVVTNEEDAVAMAAVGALGAAVSNRVEAAEGSLQAEIAGATNAVVQAALRAAEAESNRVDSTYAKRSEIPAAPDLAPYALKSELPQDYLVESDITNFATRAWIKSQNYAREGTVYTRLDAQDLAIDAATNALWAAHLAERARLDTATNALGSVLGDSIAETSNRLDAATNELMRAVRDIEIAAADSNAVTRLVTPDGTTWQDATGCVWKVSERLGGWIIPEGAQCVGGTVLDVEWSEWQDQVTYEAVWGWRLIGRDDAEILYGETNWNARIIVHGDDTYIREVAGRETNLVNRVAYTNDLAATDLTPATNYTDQVATELATRKQDALPYPTNAIPYAAISGGPEWREVTVWTEAEEPVHYVTNGMMHVIHGTTAAFTVQSAGWPNGAAMYVEWDYSATPIAQLPSNLRLVGYGTWPTNDFKSVWWRSGATIYVNILIEE